MGSHSSSVPFYADVLVVIPSVISFVVVVVLLSLVYIIFTRKPRHPNDIYGKPAWNTSAISWLIYSLTLGNFNGDSKLQNDTNESVIMGDLDCKTEMKKTPGLEHKYHQMAGCPANAVQFQSPYAMTNLQRDHEERLQLNHMTLRGSPMKAVNLNFWNSLETKLDICSTIWIMMESTLRWNAHRGYLVTMCTSTSILVWSWPHTDHHSSVLNPCMCMWPFSSPVVSSGNFPPSSFHTKISINPRESSLCRPIEHASRNHQSRFWFFRLFTSQ